MMRVFQWQKSNIFTFYLQLVTSFDLHGAMKLEHVSFHRLRSSDFQMVGVQWRTCATEEFETVPAASDL